MEDSPLLLIFLIIYLIAASSENKKKEKKKKKILLRAEEGRRRDPVRAPKQGEEADWRSILQTQQVQQGFSVAFEQHGPQDEECEKQPIHLHEVAQRQMAQAEEGEDPCHAGGHAPTTELEADFAVWQDEDQSTLPQDILRGVVMSEVLTRPMERATLNAAKRQRRYHG